MGQVSDTQPRLHVLLAEDDPDLAELFRSWLWSRFNVSVALDGLDALRQARAHHPDVVVLDIVMPGLHGTTVAWILRNDPRYDDVPIVIFTGRLPAAAEPPDLDEGVLTWAEAVADVRTAKPCRPEDLEEAITRALLERPRRARHDDRLVPRFDVLLNARLEAGGRAVEAQVLSLSLSGAFVECPAGAPALGSEATLTFDLGPWPFGLACRVVHEGQLRESPGVGIRFHKLSIDEETRLIKGLAAILKRTPGPTSAAPVVRCRS